MKCSLAHLLTFVTAAIAADQQLVIWVPNECDSFRGLPEELQSSFQDLNLHNTGQYHPVVTDMNDIYAHYTYNVAYVTAATSATWSYITTGQHPPTTKLTSSYNAATCPIPGNTTGTVSENSSGASATVSSTAGTGVGSTADNGATASSYAGAEQTTATGTTLTTSTIMQTTQVGTDTAQSTVSITGSTASSGVFSSVASSDATQQSTTASATTIKTSSETYSSTAGYPTGVSCFRPLDFWVDPSLPPKTIKEFCNGFDNGVQAAIFSTPAHYMEDEIHKLAVYIEMRSLTETNAFNKKDCFDALDTTWACTYGLEAPFFLHALLTI